MCGIAGCIAKDIREVPANARAQMRASIQYRGRDGEGEWTDNQHVHFFHARLSIIDLNTGQQPMWDASGRYAIVYNGEIYNYKELRQEYEKRGARFHTQSDTEVILAGFALKREKVCADLNGMFAVAIWDSHEKRLFLARDHLGKKPLFWCTLGGKFFFASTLDAFTAIPEWRGKISSGAVATYSILGSFPEETTIYEEAYALPYASYCYVEPGGAPTPPQRYWRMDFSTKSKQPLAALIEEYESILLDAVAIRLRSDVPLALTFSGGVDSGTIAALCAKNLNFPLTCYTIDYHTLHDPSEETINAQKAAELLGLKWEYIHFDYHNDLLTDLPETYMYYDQPSNQLPLVYSQRLYEAIKPHAKVVLSGNGADELFAGYISYESLRRNDVLLKFGRWLKPAIDLASRIYSLAAPARAPQALVPILQFPAPEASAVKLRQSAAGVISAPSDLETIEQVAQKIASEARASRAFSLLDFRMFTDLTCNSNDANYRLPDISGLAAQVEVRSPYLDYRMVEFAARLPHRYKLASFFQPAYNKYLPKVYYNRHVPDEIAWSRKKGMGWNLRWDLSVRENPKFAQMFDQAYSALERSALNAAPYRQAWARYLNGDASLAGLMMAGFMLGAWLLKRENIRPVR
jgi:asparagine synthase (glutamine-hydrolysing)